MSMTWKDLQEQAAKIVANTPQGEFTDESFKCSSGGSPSNEVGVPEVYRNDTARYLTTANGYAYRGEVVIRCRVTGAVDMDKRTIYEAQDGTLFVYRHRSGDAGSFDRGWLKSPRLPK